MAVNSSSALSCVVVSKSAPQSTSRTDPPPFRISSTMRARRARPPELFSPQEAQGSSVPFTDPVKRMVTVRAPSAVAARGEKIPDRITVMKRRKNRFIAPPVNVFSCWRDAISAPGVSTTPTL